MAGYMVCWPQDRWKEIKKAGDTGPIKVIYGSIHARMPTIASIKVGDIVFPVTQMNKHLYVLARLPVTHKERALDYTMRELGRPCGALGAYGRDKEDNGYPKFDYYDSLTPTLPHLEHQVPFNCCSQWAVWGEEGSSIEPRQLPDEVLPDLRFGYPKSKEKALRFSANGGVLPMSLTATRRMSEETLEIFEGLFR